MLKEDDAAYANWGGSWRMPTKWQLEKLIANTNNAWVENYNGTGISGYKFTNKNDASKFIFLPTAGFLYEGSSNNVGSDGYYWSSSLDTDNPSYAYFLDFCSWDVIHVNNRYRSMGRPVRPVQK